MTSKAFELARLGSAYSDGGISGSNLVINGEFLVSQRGDYTTATSVSNDTYYVDRWKVRLTGVTADIEHIKGSNASPNYPNTGSNTLKLTATSTASGVLRHLQQVEGFLGGRELTFSAWVKSNSSDARVFQFQHGTGTRVASTAHSGNGQWEKLTVTATNNATSDNQLYFDAAIASSSFGNVSITSGDYIEIAEVQLEFGPEATPFEHRSYSDQLQACQRFFETNYDDGTALGSVVGNSITYGVSYRATSATNNYYSVPLKVIKRSAPTITIYNGVTGATGTWRGSSNTDRAISANSNVGFININGPANGDFIRSGFFAADAEL